MGSPRSTGDTLLRIGAIVTVIGLACTLIAMLPLIIPSLELPSAWWFLSMITGVGLALVILGLAVFSPIAAALTSEVVSCEPASLVGA